MKIIVVIVILVVILLIIIIIITTIVLLIIIKISIILIILVIVIIGPDLVHGPAGHVAEEEAVVDAFSYMTCVCLKPFNTISHCQDINVVDATFDTLFSKRVSTTCCSGCPR